MPGDNAPPKPIDAEGITVVSTHRRHAGCIFATSANPTHRCDRPSPPDLPIRMIFEIHP